MRCRVLCGVGRIIRRMMIFGLCLGNRAFPRFFRARVLSVAYYRVSRPAYLFLHRCPQLKSIGVGFGALLPGVRSHVRCSSSTRRLLCPTCDHCIPPQLFDFKNLEGFSLRFEPAFYTNGYFDMTPGEGNHIAFRFNCFLIVSFNRNRKSQQRSSPYSRGYGTCSFAIVRTCAPCRY